MNLRTGPEPPLVLPTEERISEWKYNHVRLSFVEACLYTGLSRHELRAILFWEKIDRNDLCPAVLDGLLKLPRYQRLSMFKNELA